MPPPAFEGHIRRKTVVLGRAKPSWPNRAADLFFRFIIGLYKAAFAAFLGFLLFASLWFIIALLGG